MMMLLMFIIQMMSVVLLINMVKLVNITSIDSNNLLSQVFQSKQHAWFNLNNKHYKILLLSYSDEILW